MRAVTQHQCNALCSGQNVFPTEQCCSARQSHSMQCVTKSHLWRFALHTGVCSFTQGKILSPPSSAALQNRWAVTQHQCTAALFRAKCSPHCSVLLCKRAHSRQCVTANTPMEICSSYRCAVTQHQCTAALLRAKCNPHCSVLQCKSG